MARQKKLQKSGTVTPGKGTVRGDESSAMPSWLEPLILLVVFTAFILIVLRNRKASPARSKANRPERSSSNELGSSDFATAEQIAKWSKQTGKLDTCLPVTDLKGAQGVAVKKGHLVIPVGERNRHILIIAKTGSGKTTKLILPVLYNDCMCPTRSTVVIDSKPEMWQKLAAMTRHYNPQKKLVLFNPLDRMRSLSWNIVSKVEDDTDAKLIANTIIMATDVPGAKSDTPFFRNNALSLLNAIMVGLLKDPNEKISMPRVHQLIHSGMKGLCDWLEAHPDAIRISRTFVELARSGSQNADTIMSEMSMRLSAWDLEAIRSTTFMDEFDLETLVAEPTLFVVELRESEIEMLRPMANVIVVEILRFLTKRAESCPGLSLPRPVSVVIDEFASALGRLPDIHVKLNTLRSRNVSIVAAIQSIGQVKAIYKDEADTVLAGFSSKILMPALEFTDAEWASKESGQMTIRFKTASTGSSKRLVDFWSNQNTNVQEHIQQRAVLTPSEIGNPLDGACTFFLPNTPVFQGHLVPFYKIPETAKRFSEFDKPEHELKLRTEAINYKELAPPVTETKQINGPAGSAPASASPQISEAEIKQTLASFKKQIDYDGAMDIAREWWDAFEAQNATNMLLVLTVAHELVKRTATINEFFLAYVYSNSDNIQENLDYLDYRRMTGQTGENAGEQKPAAPSEAATTT